MKKTFLMLGISVLAVLASCKKEASIVSDVLEIINAPSETTIAKEGTEDAIVVTFKASKPWTAAAEQGNGNFVTLSPKAGEPADVCTLKVNVAENNTEVDRDFKVIIQSEGLKSIELSFTQQSQFHMNIAATEYDVSKDGDEFTITVDANVEFTVDDKQDVFTWQHVVPSNDGKTYKVTIDANSGYDLRTSYVKFTTTQIQDEEGNDLAISVNFKQEGSASVVWHSEFTWDLYNESHRYSTANAGDYYLVSTGLGVKAYKKSDGTYVRDLDLGIVPTGITNDDAGNIVCSMGGDYPFNEDYSLNEEKQVPLTVLYLPAGDLDPKNAKVLISAYNNEFWGYGLDNIRVTGDVTKDACITMFSGAGAGGYILFWDVKDGEIASDKYTDYVTYGSDVWGLDGDGNPAPSGVWSSAHCVAKSLGNAAGTGVMAMGYDGAYDFFYNPTTSQDHWQKVYDTYFDEYFGIGNEGFNALDFIDWGGHKYAATVMMTYFGKVDWAGDGNYSYSPSFLYLLNVDDPVNPVLLSRQPYYMTEGDQFVYGSSTDVNLELEGDDLVAYVLDSGTSCYFKVKYPKL